MEWRSPEGGVGVRLRRVERVKSMVTRDLNSEEHNAIHR